MFKLIVGIGNEMEMEHVVGIVVVSLQGRILAT